MSLISATRARILRKAQRAMPSIVPAPAGIPSAMPRQAGTLPCALPLMRRTPSWVQTDFKVRPFTTQRRSKVSNSACRFRNIQRLGKMVLRISTFSGVYQLPVGRGRYLLGNANRFVDTLIGGWKVGALYLYESGRPWQPNITGTCGAGQHNGLGGTTGCFETPYGINPIKTPRHTVAGTPSVIRGATPCVGDRNPTTGAIVLRAGAIAYGCTQANIVYKALYAPV